MHFARCSTSVENGRFLMDMFDGRDVLVSGATGFIGRNLVDALVRRGARVHALVRDLTRARSLLPDRRIHLIPGDVRDPRSWHDAIEADTIFHLAGHAHAMSDVGNESSSLHQRTTVEGTRHLLYAAGQAGARRFIFASSVKAMSESTGSVCLDESVPANPGSVYGSAKLTAERLVTAVGEEYGLHTCSLRLPMVFGPHNKGNLPRMIEAIDRGRFPPLPVLNNKRSMVHVDDVIQGLLLAAERPEARGNVYIITDGRVYSTRQIYTAICAALGRPVPKWVVPVSVLNIAARAGDIVGRVMGRRFMLDSEMLEKLIGSACYSSEKINKELGYVPTRTLVDALPDMVAAYKADI